MAKELGPWRGAGDGWVIRLGSREEPKAPKAVLWDFTSTPHCPLPGALGGAEDNNNKQHSARPRLEPGTNPTMLQGL